MGGGGDALTASRRQPRAQFERRFLDRPASTVHDQKQVVLGHANDFSIRNDRWWHQLGTPARGC